MRLNSRIQSAARPIWKTGVHKSLENHPRIKGQFTAFHSEVICARNDSINVQIWSIKVMGRYGKRDKAQGKGDKAKMEA